MGNVLWFWFNAGSLNRPPTHPGLEFESGRKLDYKAGAQLHYDDGEAIHYTARDEP